MENLKSACIEKKRKRSANWDSLEKNLLRNRIKDLVAIIENKSTDTNNNKTKNDARQKITERFNKMNSRERSIVEIKQQWRTIKLEAKTKLSSYKKECSGTGGGPKPPSPDPETNEILEMIPQEFEMDSNNLDSDGLTLQNKDSEAICETKDAEVKTVDSDQIMITPVTSKGTTLRYDSLYNIIPSKVKASKRKLPLGVNELAIQRTKVLTNCIGSEHTLKIEQMRESHEWGRREHELRINNLELENRLLRNKLSNN